MDGNESKRLVKGALLLTLAGLISKILSAGYRIPLQNLTGDIGFYIYQQVYPFLGIALVLSLYGFPSAISKMTVDLKAEGKLLSFTGFYVPIFLVLVGINGGVFFFLLLNAQSIALWMGDVHLESTLKVAAFTFLLIPFTALLRGVFQGNYQMKPTAISQISEQFVRVMIIILAAAFLVTKGKNIYEIGQAAAIASIVGAIVAFLALGLFFIKQKPWISAHDTVPLNYIVRTILIFGMVAALNHMVLLVIQFADAFTLVPSLMEYGLSQQEAMEAKGVFDRGQPLIQLGTVLGSSFALALIPTISKKRLERDPDTFYDHIRSALSFSLYLAVGATIGLIIIFPEANTLLFQDEKGTASLRVLVIAILLCSVAITASSILQGLGFIKRTASFILIAFFVKWIMNQLLVSLWGITGSAIATVFSLLILCFVVLMELRRKLPHLRFLEQIKWRALAVSSIGMAGYLYLINYLASFLTLSSRFELLIYVIVTALTGALVYILLLLRFHAFTEKELSLLPFAPFLIRLHKGEVPKWLGKLRL